MSKFARSNTVRPIYGTSPVRTGETPTRTFEGAAGFSADAKGALFNLALTNMVSEATFYESATDRDERFESLVHEVASTDPEWIEGFIPWLRNTGNMRSASLVAAIEAGRQFLADGRPGARALIASACSRADEPAEALAYWLARYGRKLPMAVKRGIADAAVELYTERAALKWDSQRADVRMGDVIELTHPTPKAPWQSALFKHLLDKRHGHFSYDAVEGLPSLPTLNATYTLEAVPVDLRRGLLVEGGSDLLRQAGFTWERLGGWIPGGMDAQAWESQIPSMGYMALLRNLRNFAKAGISDAMVDFVNAKLADPEEIAASRQFPYRFWSAHRYSGTLDYTRGTERGLQGSCGNIPVLPGRTLVAVDTSASMNAVLSAKSEISRVEAAALFGAAVGVQSDVDVLIFGQTCAFFDDRPTSLIRSIETLVNAVGSVGHATNTWQSVKAAFDDRGPYDRVIIFTDDQATPFSWRPADSVSVYVWDFAGYNRFSLDTSKPNNHIFTGFNDSAFKMIPLLERGSDVGYPWEQG